MKIIRKHNIVKRLLCLLLCLFCAVLPLLPALCIPIGAADSGEPTVSLKWKSGTETLNGAAFSKDSDKLTAVLELNGNASGVVKVEVATFNITATTAYYTQFRRTYELSNANRSVEVDVRNGGSTVPTKSGISAKVEDHTYKKQFGIRISKVENGRKDPDNSTLRAQVYYPSGTVISANKNSSSSIYDSNDNKSSSAYYPGGYVFSGATGVWGHSLYIADVGDEETSRASFNLPNSLGTESAKALYKLHSDANIYFYGWGTIDDSGWVGKEIGGFTLTLYDQNSSSHVFFKGDRGKGINYDNVYFDWLDFDYNNGCAVDNRVMADSRTSKNAAPHHVIKGTVENIGISFYNHSTYADKDLSGFKYNVFLADTDAPEVVSYTIGTELYGKNDTVFISVKFDEIVQVDGNGNDLSDLKLQTLIGGKTVYFEYVDGIYTDTLIFGATLTEEYVSDSITILEFKNSYSTGNSGVRIMDMMWNLGNLNNVFEAPRGNVSNPLATLSVNIDTRDPEIKSFSCDTKDKTMRQHTVSLEIKNMTDMGNVYYAWSESADRNTVTEWIGTAFNTSGSTSITGNDLTGNYYLHIKAVTLTGQVAYGTTDFSLSFDNEYVRLESVDCQNNTMGLMEHALTVTVKESDMQKLACVNMYVRDQYGDYLISGETVYNASNSSNRLSFEGNVGRISLKSTDIGMVEGEFKWVVVGFETVDKYGNISPSPAYSTYVVYDNRTDFTVTLDKAPEKSHDGYDVYFINNKYNILFDVPDSGVPGAPTFFGVYSIKRNGKYIFNLGDENNAAGKAYTVADLIEANSSDPLGDLTDLLAAGWINVENAESTGFRFVVSDLEAMEISMYADERAVGFYEFVFFANGKRAEHKLFFTGGEDDTENYLKMAESGLLSNEVWKFATNKFYSFVITSGEGTADVTYNISGTSYSADNSYPIFSSKEKAYEYALYKELQDVSLMYIDESMSSVAAALNSAGSSGHFVKAAGETTTAAIGQTWIRYKSSAWTPGSKSSAQHWVYYYYSNTKETEIDVGRIITDEGSTILGRALENNAKEICNYDGDWTYLTKNNNAVNSNGQPTYNSAGIFYAAEEYKGSFKEPIAYSGDRKIYNNLIDYTWGTETFKDVVLVSDYTFTSSDGATTVYYRLYGGESNTVLYQSVRLEQGETAALRSMISASGLYEIIETGRGYRKFLVYVDYDVPVLEYSYVRNGSHTTAYLEKILNGSTIRGSNITLKGIVTGADGAHTVEYDDQAYVYVTNNAGTRVVLFATLKELADAEDGIEIPAGDYKLYVYDRLGNHVCVNIRTNATPLCVSGALNSSGDTLIVDVNRASDEIESFSVTKNGLEYAIEYATQMKFRQSGIYEITVSDIFGESVSEIFELDRGLPSVEFMYQNEKGVFVPFGDGSDGNAHVEQIDEITYQIVTSADVKLKYSGSYTVTAEAGDPVIKTAMLGGSVTISDPDAAGWTVRVALSNDPSTFILVSCGYDKTAPDISATANIPTYSFNEREDKGNVLFVKLPGMKQIAIDNETKISAESVTLEWNDQNRIREAYYVKDGVKYNLTEEELLSQTLTLSGDGVYEVFVSDVINNTSSFKFTLTKEIALEYFIGGVKTEYHSSPLDAIVDGKFDYTQKTGKDITLVLGEALNIAFMYSDGTDTYIYEIYYDESKFTVIVYDYAEDHDDVIMLDNFKSEGTEGVLLDGIKYPTKLRYMISDGKAILTIPACEKEYELFQIRFSDERASYPYLIQVERSNRYPNVKFIKEGESTPLESGFGTFIGVNTPVEILPSSIDDTVSTITAYYSENFTVDFDGTESFVIYDGTKLHKISDAGYYKIVVQNVYGNEQTVYIRIGYDFDVSAELNYDSGDRNEYSFTHGSYTLYTNGGARIFVWAALSDCTFEATLNGSAYTPVFKEQDAGFYIDVSRVGEYVFLIKDFCEHEIEITLSVKAPEKIDYDGYLTGFNQDALYKDRSYTNAPLDILFDRIAENGIGKISYKYNAKGAAERTVVVYDVIAQQKTEHESNDFIGAIGKDGNGEYTVTFMDNYGNTVSKTVYISSAEQLVIERIIQTDPIPQAYSLADAVARGAWSNRSIILKDLAAASELKVNGEAATFTDRTYRLDFPANLGQGHETYTVEYLDEYGNKYSFTVNLYRKVPEVSFTEETSFTEIGGTVYVRGEFGYEWNDANVTAVYSKGKESFSYGNGESLSGEGTYVFTFTDLAGNTAIRTLVYDTVVEYKLVSSLDEVRSGIATNGMISIKPNGEAISIVSVKRDGLDHVADSMNFSEHGYYEVTLGDAVGNTTVVRFYIITHAFNDFTYVAQDGYAITEVWFTVDGFKLSYVGDVVIDEEGKQSYLLSEAGTYELAITDLELDKSYSFTVSIDRTPPTATLVGAENGGVTRNPVTLDNLNIGDLVEVYKDGKLVFSKRVATEVTDPPMIESSGDFRIVVTDEAGNSIEYTFHKEFATNLASNVIILMMMLLTVAGAMMYLYLGKKVRVK